MRNKQKLCIRTLTFMLLFSLLFPVSARAAGPIDVNKDVSLTISYRHDGKGISGTEFRLYRVADVDAYGAYTPSGWFSSYPIYTEGLDLQGWRSLALTLSGYVLRDNIPATDSGNTDINGMLIFPTDASKHMKPGLYLVTSAKHSFEGYTYTAAPFMAALPVLDKQHNDWQYALTVSPKYEREKEVEKLTRKVLKVWDDRGSEGSRPAEVTVDLLKNGEVFDTVALNSKNNWRYTWTDLDGKYEWTVVEREVSGYIVKVEKTGVTYTVTNTKKPVPPSPAPSTPPVKPPPKLPQTGMLWWPAQLLAFSGMILVLIGMLRRRGDAE